MHVDSATPESEPITYRFDMGDGWSRIRLDESADVDVSTLLDSAFEGIPPEAAERARSTLTAQFAAQIVAARARRGIDLYVPTPKPHGRPVPAAAVLTAEVVVPTDVVLDPAEVVARVVARSRVAHTGSIGGSPAVRLDHTLADAEVDVDAAAATAAGDADAKAGEAELTRFRIEYVVAVPNDPRWLSIDLGVQPTADFPLEPTVSRFDEAVSALTFT